MAKHKIKPVLKADMAENKQQRLIDYLKRNFNLRYNLLLGEVIDLNTKEAIDPNEVWNTLRLKDLNYSLGDIRRTMELSSISPVYHPVQDYFESLPKWDGEDHIQHILDMVTLKDGQNRDLFEHHHRKFFMRIVNSVFGGGMNKNSPIWIGGQDAGKTTFQKLLCPYSLNIFQKTYFPNTEITKRDMYFRFWLIIDEFKKLGDTSLQVLKSTMTESEETFKVDGSLRRMARLSAIWFNSNYERVLSDPSGNNRFLPFMIEKCDIVSLARYDIHQFWAQVYHEWKDAKFEKQDQDIFLVTSAENKVMDEIRVRHTTVSREETVVTNHLVPGLKGDDENSVFMTPREIAEVLSRDFHITVHPNKLGMLLKENSFERVQTRRENKPYPEYGYYVRFVNL